MDATMEGQDRDQAHRIQCCRTCRWRQGRQDGTVSRHSRNLALNARVQTPQMGSEMSSFLTDGRQCSGSAATGRYRNA